MRYSAILSSQIYIRIFITMKSNYKFPQISLSSVFAIKRAPHYFTAMCVKCFPKIPFSLQIFLSQKHDSNIKYYLYNFINT